LLEAAPLATVSYLHIGVVKFLYLTTNMSVLALSFLLGSSSSFQKAGTI
jgi:hypothetical protein